MRAIAVRNVPLDLSSAPERGQRRRVQCPNRTVDELLRRGLGVGTTRSNGLARLAGGWTDEQAAEMEEPLAPFGTVDTDMWR